MRAHLLALLAIGLICSGGCRTSPRTGEAVATTEARPSGYVDERLAAHRTQLTTLAGGAVVDTHVDAWRQRSGGGADGELGAAIGRLDSASSGAGDVGGFEVGIGGLGLRGAGLGEGGSGEGIGLGSIGTVGRGNGGAAGSRATLDFADDSIAGALAKPDGAGLAEGAPPLRAGSTDDNAAFDDFLRFVAERTASAVPTGAMKIEVSGRRFVRVVDRDGRPFPGLEIVVRDWRTERVVATAMTYGDGSAPFYAGAEADEAQSGHSWLVEASDGVRAVTAIWHGASRAITLRMPVPAPSHEAVPLDVLFLVDTTGSMGDEIDRIKQTLLSMTAKVRQAGGRAVDLRYGAVLYRDLGDAYVTATRDFTGDIDAFDASLRDVQADGGGDTPESLNQGLAEAMVGVQWRPRAAKVAFLVADAVPHMDYQDDIPYGESLKDAVTLGVRIHAVAASGLADDEAGSLVFRQIAQYARGHFIFIEYGSDVAASAAAHGVTGPVAANNLDEILLREIRSEIDGWGV